MEDFQQSLFQMVSFRMMGARILPSLLSLLPQTEIFRDWCQRATLEFCPYFFPEFVFTGHEVYRGGRIELPEKHREYFDLILGNPDVFPGFYHIDLEGNVLPSSACCDNSDSIPTPSPPQPTPRAAGPTPPAAWRRSWPPVRPDESGGIVGRLADPSYEWEGSLAVPSAALAITAS
jgi:hypothetical protein